MSTEAPDDASSDSLGSRGNREASSGFLFSSLVLFVLALGVRALHTAQLRSAPFFELKLGDARSYDAWARQIAAGDWLGSGVFYQAGNPGGCPESEGGANS